MSAVVAWRSAADGERRGPSRRRRAAIAGAGLFALAAALAWLERVPIATGFVDRELARNGVPARYRIADLGFGRQRLTDVVIGDPAHPDLVADWIETRVDYGLSGPYLAGASAGRVRLRGEVKDGRVSLGSLERLLPAPSGKPFALPALTVAVRDGGLWLATPAGRVAIAFTGRGRLDGGFRGHAALAAPVLASGGCTLGRPRASLAVAIDDARPAIAGPVGFASVDCGKARAGAGRATLAASFGAALDRWQGNATLALADPAGAGAWAARIAGTIGFTGDRHATQGRVDLAADRIVHAQGSARRATLAGSYTIGGTTHFVGRATAEGARWAGATRLVAQEGAAAGTPLAPLVRRLARAARVATSDVAVDADLGWDAGTLSVTRATARAASGAQARFVADAPVATPDGLRIDGMLALGGGGLPDVKAQVTQPRPGAALAGMATIAPYAADGAILSLAPVRFALGDGLRLDTVATLSGPLGDGRVERLTLPLALRRDTRGTITVNTACTLASFARLAVAGLDLKPARLTLCPVDGALARIGDTIGGGARIAAPRLAGTLGGTPLTLAADGATLRLGANAFAIDALAARLGDAARTSRLDIASLTGRIDGSTVAGRFADARGAIGNVPLVLDRAAGDWRLAGGRLTLGGALRVSDAAGQRFEPMDARDVSLTLAGGRIAATGTLHEPTRGTKVADVRIAHELGSGRGHADLTVPGITFGEGFQPELLTRTTFGVIADVKGRVDGAGRIDWSPAGVTSTGRFATAGLDLAAAFGPVTGIAGTIDFTDLLALESAPGQVATVASINPGVPVTDGRITYQTLAGTRVRVEGGRWPFAGGTLTLEPTLLDFSSPQVRHMTFRVDGIDAARFLQQFDFDNLDATGTFDGVLPMAFDESGGRIENGRLTVREGGGTLAYVGDLTEKNLGFWGNLAFQALKSLRYRNLNIVMNGPLAGEMVTEVRFAGVSQGEGAKSNFLIRRLQRLPFVFNITIRAPFRGLLDSAASFYDPRRLIERNLPALLEEQRRREAVQPPASAIVPPAKQD